MAGKNTAAFGIYPSRATAEIAVDQLISAGFSHADISVLAVDTVDLSGYVGLQIDEYSHDHREEKSGVQQIEDGNESLPRKKSRCKEHAGAGQNDFEGDGVSTRNEHQADGEEHREPDISRFGRQSAQGGIARSGGIQKRRHLKGKFDGS